MAVHQASSPQDTISYIIPSINRPTLHDTIASIEMRTGDEICLEFDLPKTGMWGNPQRNKAIRRAGGDWLAFIDDDDKYVSGHREIMAKAIRENPGKAILFQLHYPDGTVIWKERNTNPGNVSTQMILIPNTEEFITEWEGGRNMADVLFIQKWPKEKVVFIDKIICEMGHPDGKKN